MKKTTSKKGGNNDGENVLLSLLMWVLVLSIGGYALYEIFLWVQGIIAHVMSGLGG